nr:hypothetical protein KPHV_86160 [Kitasatospora purpeofusca]
MVVPLTGPDSTQAPAGHPTEKEDKLAFSAYAQGWALTKSGTLLFDDGGAYTSDGTVVPPLYERQAAA